MADRFAKTYTAPDSPAVDGFFIAANSSVVFSQATRSLYVGSAGNVCVQMLSYNNANTVLTFPNVPAGSILPIRVATVFANSTANGFVGLF